MKVRLVRGEDGSLTVMATSSRRGRKLVVYRAGKGHRAHKACIEQAIAEAYSPDRP